MGKTPVRPSNPRTTTSTSKKTSGTTTNKGKTDNKKKAKDPNAQARADAKAAEARAVAREKAAKTKAGKRFLEGAENLTAQANAIREALNVSLARNRDNNLADVGRVLEGQLSQLKLGHSQRAQEFLSSATNTEKATAAQAEGGFSNAVRERQDAMSALLEQGAGESDAMRTMLMAARNWHANATEGNRAFYDTMQSINQGIVDLNIDTRSSMANAFTASEGERDRLWQDFYNRRSEAFTQLGNTLGQQADYYAQAKEMGVKPKKGVEAAAEKAMKQAFMDSSQELGKSYTQQGLPEWISGFTGQAKLDRRLNNTDLAAAVEFEQVGKAEGATLRKWAA